MSENGKVLEGIIIRHALIVANGVSSKRSGIITRERVIEDSTERSVIDLVLLSSDLAINTDGIIIDEDKKISTQKYHQN